MADERVLITGKTYDVREELKALGGRWDPAQKAWSVPKENAAAAQKLVVGVSERKSGMKGELWQECQARGCSTEPVCLSCMYCERHCQC